MKKGYLKNSINNIPQKYLKEKSDVVKSKETLLLTFEWWGMKIFDKQYNQLIPQMVREFTVSSKDINKFDYLFHYHTKNDGM